MGFVTIPLLFGVLMGIVDIFVLSLLKLKYNKAITSQLVFVVAFLLYGFQTLIFYKALGYGSLTQMNVLWDVTSDVFVTIVGIYVFNEAIGYKQQMGILLAIISIILLK